ncbi:MAG: LPS assembly lipoprotein LptE, partial [Ignavibacteria bacterium]|nr:LPS assembly lipoprotein LptE [Ignavibacteria bacterium]
FVIIILSISSLNCGVYGFRGNNPPEGINTIAVPTFRDESGFSDPALADDLTQRLKVKIISDNTFRIADKNISDAILNCTITNIKDEALVIASGDNVTKRKVTITVNVKFENLKKQKLIWEKISENYGEYNSSGNTFSERAERINIAKDKIAEDIIIDITSNW